MPSEYDTPEGAVDFQYSGTTERIRKQTADEVTLYLGGFYERVTDTSSRSITERHYIRVGDRVVAVHERQDGTSRFTPPTFDTVYIHTDNLGSVDVITDAKGDLVERRSYDAFGARRNPVWDAATQPKSFTSPGTTLGYTGQEADDELGLVNMKGRIYDPKLARFLRPDPVVSRPLSGQSWNRYSYVLLNNPLRYIDPTGFDEGDPPTGSSISEDGAIHFGDDPLIAPSNYSSGTSTPQPLPNFTPITTRTDFSSNGAAPALSDAISTGSGTDPGLVGGQPGVELGHGPGAQRDFSTTFGSALSQQVNNNWGTIASAVFLPAAALITAYQQIATITDPSASGTQKAVAGVGFGLTVLGVPEGEAGGVLGAAEHQATIVYRGLAAGEDAAAGLLARAPAATDTPLSHVAGKIQSQWISTTKELGAAVEKYGSNGVVAIDLSKVSGSIVDLSAGVPGARVGTRLWNYAVRDAEVLIQGSVPPEAILWSRH